jgi:hypothetical protein
MPWSGGLKKIHHGDTEARREKEKTVESSGIPLPIPLFPLGKMIAPLQLPPCLRVSVVNPPCFV